MNDIKIILFDVEKLEKSLLDDWNFFYVSPIFPKVESDWHYQQRSEISRYYEIKNGWR